MRAQLARAVRECFDRHLKEVLPQFQRLRGLELPAQFRAYEWPVTETFRFHVLLQLHDSEDSFTLEVGWTCHGRWPAYVSPPRTLDEALPAEEMRFRIGLLWSANADHWWDLAPRLSAVPLEEALRDFEGFLGRFQAPPPIPEVLTRVEPTVTEAVARLRDDAIPFFARVAAARGHTLMGP